MTQIFFRRWKILAGAILVTSVISCSTASQSSPQQSEQQKAAQVVRDYYDALGRKNYDRAYVTWRQDDEPNRESFEEFKQRFANTASISAEVGIPGEISAAADTLVIRIPVLINATTRSGDREKSQGIYYLSRCTNVSRCSPLELSWRIGNRAVKRVE